MNTELRSRFDALEASRKALTESFLSKSPGEQQAHHGLYGKSFAEALHQLTWMEQSFVKALQKTPPAKLSGKKTLDSIKVAIISEGLRQQSVHEYARRTSQRSIDPQQIVVSLQAQSEAFAGFLEQVSDPSAGFIQLIIFGPVVSASDVLSMLEAETSGIEQYFLNEPGGQAEIVSA